MSKKIAITMAGLMGLMFLGLMMGGCGGAVREVNDYYYPNWLPDGRIICSKIYTKSKDIGLGTWERVERKHYVTVMDDAGNNEQDLFEVSSAIKEITCSPTGELIAYITKADGTIMVSNYTGTSQTTLPGISSAEYVDWSPDATQLVYSNSDNELHVVNRDGTSDTQIATSAEAVAWRVGEKIVYEFQENGYLYLGRINVDGISQESFGANSVYDPQISSSSADIIYGLAVSAYRRLNVSIVPPVEEILIPSLDFIGPKLSFDNTKIVGGDFYFSDIKNIYIINIDGTNEEQIK